MAGKKKGKKGKTQDEKAQPSGSQQVGSSGQQVSQGPQDQPRAAQGQGEPQGRQQQQRESQGQKQQQSPPGEQQPQQGPQGQPPKEPQGQQQQWHPRGQQPAQPPPSQVPPASQPQHTAPLPMEGFRSLQVSGDGGEQQFQGGRGQRGRGRGQTHQVSQGPPQVPYGYETRQTTPTPGGSSTARGEGQQHFQGGQGRGGRGGGRGRGQPHQASQRPQVPPGYETREISPVASTSSSMEGFPSVQVTPGDVGQQFQGQQSRGGSPSKGQGRGQSHQVSQRPSQVPSTSSAVAGSASSEVSKMQVSKIEAGQGDSQLVPRTFSQVKAGTRGRKIIVETNYFPLNLGQLKTAIHYDVKMTPDVPKKLLRPAFEEFRKVHFPKYYPAFDGRKNLYSPKPLPFDDFISDDVYVEESKDKNKKFSVEIKFANNVDLTPLHNLLKSKQIPRESLQVVDIVLRCAPAKECISVGRSFFSKPGGHIVDLGQGMEMYTGFYQSAVRGWKPLLNVDVANKAFPKNLNVIDLLCDLFSTRFNTFTLEQLKYPLDPIHLNTLSSFIKTLKIVYELPGHPSTRRVYRVNGIDQPPREKMFTLDKGQRISIEKYFESIKNCRLKYPHLPTLWVGSREREDKILLPLELCEIEEGQVVNRKMNEDQTTAMIRLTAGSTTQRKEKIMNSLMKAEYNKHATVKEFGFSVGNEFEKLEARVLTPPQLGYMNQQSVEPRKGVWRNLKFFSGVIINKWTIVCVDNRPARPNEVSGFADTIQKNAVTCGMTIRQPAEKPFENINGKYKDAIENYFKIKKDKNYDVIFVIVPNSGPQYSFVKKAAEINAGCLTQCIKSRTLGKMNPQTAINILLKVNSKLNGTNHILNTRPPIMKRPCMIMGADVTHPSPDARDIPSVAAVTASHDPKAFQYNICWRLQPPKVEIIEDLEAIAKEQLLYFYQKTNCKPERIVFFRDGVSEGQFEQVLNAEVRAVRSACKKLQAEGYEPSITFLVVQKRHHTRLFPTNPRDSEDKNFNVPAGTCVDSTITDPFKQDFYLVSHASIQGVAKPTRYCTLWDDNNMSHDDIEELTYYLCHMFTRCNRSVSYPAPTYYAHLAAARAKVYIENEKLNMEILQKEFHKFQIRDNIRKGLPMFFV